MAVLVRLFDFVPGTLIQSGQVDSEFNQLVNILSGVSTDKDALIKYNHATDPALRLDQIGAGAIQHWLQNGSEKSSIRNNGALRINSSQTISDPQKIAVNVDSNNSSNTTACIQTAGSADQALRLAMEAVTGAGSNNISAFSVTKFLSSAVQTFAQIRAGGEIRVSPGYPSDISNNPAVTVGPAVTLGGQYLQQLNQVGNVTTGEDDLHSHTLAANVLANDGDSIYFSACGTILAVGTTKQLRMFFGGTAIFTSGLFDPAVDFAWSINGDITRIDSDSVVCNVLCLMGDGVIGGNAALANRATQVNGLTFSNTQVVKWTGQDTDGTSDRVVQTMSVIRKFARAQ